MAKPCTDLKYYYNNDIFIKVIRLLLISEVRSKYDPSKISS